MIVKLSSYSRRKEKRLEVSVGRILTPYTSHETPDFFYGYNGKIYNIDRRGLLLGFKGPQR